MTDTKISNETTRSPIDGTEFAVLATSGANWKVQVRDLLAPFVTLTQDGAYVKSASSLFYHQALGGL